MGEMSSAGGEPKAVGSLPSVTSATSAGPSAPPSPPGRNRFGFPKSARLLQRAAFRRVYDQGSRVTSSSFALFFAPRTAALPEGPRVGLTIPRKIGKSVIRNRIRRRIREALRLELPAFSKPVDYVFHPRLSVLGIEFPQLRREVERMLRRCEAAPTVVAVAP